jgi:type II secretory pathway component PulK
MGFGFRHPGASRARPPGVRPRRRAQGTVIIVAMWILLVLAGLVLVLARSMRVEGDRAANDLAAVQAAAVEQGAVQYVLANVDGLQGLVPADASTPCEAVAVGDGWFWILRPSASSDTAYSFGITDEAGKLNLNTATLDMLSKLPDMTTELAASIIDRRDADSNITTGGAESEYYLMLPDPYECKNGPLETIEELFLVRGATKEILYGDDVNRNGVLDPGENPSSATSSSSLGGTGSRLDRGIYNFITVYSVEPAATARLNVNAPTPLAAIAMALQGVVSSDRMPGVLDRIRRDRPFRNMFDFYFRAAFTLDEFKKVSNRFTTNSSRTPVKGLININTAPREVLLCLPMLEDGDVAALIAQRVASSTTGSSGTFGSSDTTNTGTTSIAWVLQALPRNKLIGIGGAVTGKSYQFSADIVSVGQSGRAFKRCRIVVDARTSPTKIIYRQNLTHLGWPLSPDILTRLRSGMGLDPGVQTIGRGIGE